MLVEEGKHTKKGKTQAHHQLTIATFKARRMSMILSKGMHVTYFKPKRVAPYPMHTIRQGDPQHSKKCQSSENNEHRGGWEGREVIYSGQVRSKQNILEPLHGPEVPAAAALTS